MNSFDGINNQAPNAQYIPPTMGGFNPPPPRKRRGRKKWVILALLVIVGGALAFGTSLLSRANSIFTNKQNIFKRFGQLIVSDDKPLQGEEQGQVNILLMGMGGPGHDGPLLTDTMIVASIDTRTSEVALVSIPRDFMVRLDGRGYSKVNAAYAYAEGGQEGGGGPAAIAEAEEITGLNIPYFAAIDFKGFVKAVDSVGGLDVMVDTTFTDSQYPNYNNGYIPPITFKQGEHHFNGETALIYARSRHGNNGEGSDFARSERQKKIMLAFKDEVMALDLTNLGTLNSLLSDFTKNFRTNMEPFELLRLAKLGGSINGDNVFSLALDPQADVICDGSYDLATGRPAPARVLAPAEPVAEPVEGEEGQDAAEAATPADAAPQEYLPDPEGVIRAYVVVPCSGKTTADVHQYLSTATALANLQGESATIEVQNASGSAVATDKWRRLAQYGLSIKVVTAKTPMDRTIIYDNTQGKKPKTLQYIKLNFKTDQADLPYTQSTSDFVVILGKDALVP